MQSQAVWKVSLSACLSHELPMGAKALHVDYQRGDIHVWLLVDPSRRTLMRSFLVAGTGWHLPEWLKPEDYIGSCRSPTNPNCWHVFDLGYTSELSPAKVREALSKTMLGDGKFNSENTDYGSENEKT